LTTDDLTPDQGTPAIKQELLKFCGPSSYALENLQSRVIYCQHYERFNDPFEFWSEIVEGVPDRSQTDRFLAAVQEWGFGAVEDVVDLGVTAEEYFEDLWALQPPFLHMFDDMRIACFGSDTDNLLMWSHYADGLRGFCIVFDEDKVVTGDRKEFITDVAYLEDPPFVDCFVYAVAQDQQDYNQMASHETRAHVEYFGQRGREGEISAYDEAAADALARMKDMWQKVFAAKPLEWRYEKERRLLMQTDQTDRQAILRPYPKDAVREIIIGERMPVDYLERLRSVVWAAYGDIPIRTARRAANTYSLVIE